eukprot:scaffold324_cov394-Prasinococcus_capsulatus_cf.AAC.20
MSQLQWAQTRLRMWIQKQSSDSETKPTTAYTPRPTVKRPRILGGSDLNLIAFNGAILVFSGLTMLPIQPPGSLQNSSSFLMYLS